MKSSRAGAWLSASLDRLWRHAPFAYAAKVLALALAYFLAAKGGLTLAYENSSVTAVWAPTGIALAALVLWGRGLWPGVALGALLANTWTGVPLITVLGITAGNTLEAVVGASLLMRVGFRPSLERARDVLALAVLAAALSTMVSATVGVASLYIGDAVSGDALLSVWRTWWLGDLGGDLLVAPFLLVFAGGVLTTRNRGRLLEAAALLVVLVGVSCLVFSSSPAREFLIFPALIWAALRFRQRGVAAGSLVVAAVAVGFTAQGMGPFAEDTPDGSLLLSQTFVGISALAALLLAAITAERDRAERTLKGAHEELELKVHERTALLTRSEAGLAEAQEIAELGSWEWDVQTDEVTWSDELYRIYGLSREEHEPTFAGYLERVHPDDRARVEATIYGAHDDHQPFVLEERILRPDGSVRHLSSRGRVFVDGEGRPERMRGVCQDVTERHRVHEALERAEERFRGAFDEAPIGMALTDPKGRFKQVNKALCEIVGYSPEQLEATSLQSVTHPDDMGEVRSQLKLMLDGETSSYKTEKRYVHASGHTVWVTLQATLLRDSSGEPTHFLVQVLDITDRRRYEKRLQYLADHDSLTGLLNRHSFEREVKSHLQRGRRYGIEGAVLVLDLDHFKYVNDSLGHSAGDELIVRVAHALGRRLRETDVLARLGGDEFAVLLPKVDEQRAGKVADELLSAVREEDLQTQDGHRARRITTSAGVAMIEEVGKEKLVAEDIMVNADLAMYDAKEDGRDRISFYSSEEYGQARMKGRLTWLERIRGALAEDRFTLLAQPIVDFSTGRASQYELLLRMKEETGDLIPPGAFLYIAERLDLIQEIDRWVVRNAIGILEEHQRLGRELTLEVNLSGRSLGDPELFEVITEELKRTGTSPERLILEVTETAAVANMSAAKSFGERLSDLGCRFALDDFGAGFGSFYYLKHLPFDFLKIDGEFVRNCRVSHTDRLVIKAVVEIARGLKKQTIAEIVGDEETVRLLTKLGVDYGQGYYLGRPGPLEEVLAEPQPEGASRSTPTRGAT